MLLCKSGIGLLSLAEKGSRVRYVDKLAAGWVALYICMFKLRLFFAGRGIGGGDHRIHSVDGRNF